MEQHVAKLALKIFRSFERDWAEYDAECEEYARQGYRPRTCFHGSPLWVDYDSICGPCEDGLGWFDRHAYRKLAVDAAYRADKEFQSRMDLYVKASTMGAPMNDAEMIPWVSAPLKRWDAPLAAQAVIALNPPF